MIDRDILDKVTTIVTHANCPDGVASAILLRDALPDARVVFAFHGSKEYEELPAEPGMLFCDLVPPEKRAREFVDAGAVVLDHHAKQRHVVEMFGGWGVFADAEKEPCVSGATLAFREVWSWTTTKESDSWRRASDFARLAGIRDTWQKKHERWDEARRQAAALRFYPWAFFERVREPFRDAGWREMVGLLEIGGVLVAREDKNLKRDVENAFGYATDRGTRVAIVPTIHTSDVADAIDADVVIGFLYGTREGAVRLQLSMRSRGGYDVGALCRSLGGGGHEPSAGAHVNVSNGDPNPYEHIRKLVDDWERGL